MDGGHVKGRVEGESGEKVRVNSAQRESEIGKSEEVRERRTVHGSGENSVSEEGRSG